LPDPVKGEEILAHIILKPEYRGKVSEQEIIDWAKENMAVYKYPRIVKFVRSLPKSAVGKVLRRVIREKEAKKTAKKTKNCNFLGFLGFLFIPFPCIFYYISFIRNNTTST